jgi:uncharacterized membrane protein YebE (DUF533 family)
METTMKKLLLAALGYFAYRKWQQNKEHSATQPPAAPSGRNSAAEDRETRF